VTTPFLGEIQIFGFNFAPSGWAQCNGATMSIQQNTALFSLLGTNYGGNGTTTFQLPNFAGRAACSQGQGPGLTQRTIGEAFGTDQVTLRIGEMPGHSHSVNVYHQSDATLQSNAPDNGYGVIGPANSLPFVPTPTANVTFATTVIGITGGSLPHENRQPLLSLNFCIALQGAFPAFD
jgi:microcystin-dependent protein